MSGCVDATSIGLKGSVCGQRYRNPFASLWKLAIADGALQWKFDAGMGLDQVGLSADHSQVFVAGRKSNGSGKANVYELNTAGSVVWRVNSKASPGLPCPMGIVEVDDGVHVWVRGRSAAINSGVMEILPGGAQWTLRYWSVIPGELVGRISGAIPDIDYLGATGDAGLTDGGGGGLSGAKVANVRLYNKLIGGLAYEFCVFVQGTVVGDPGDGEPVSGATPNAGWVYTIETEEEEILPIVAVVGPRIDGQSFERWGPAHFSDPQNGFLDSWDSGDELYACARKDSNGDLYLAGRRSKEWDGASPGDWATLWKLDDDLNVLWFWDSVQPLHIVGLVESTGDIYVASDTPNDLWDGASGTTANIWKLNSSGVVQWSANTGGVVTAITLSGGVLCVVGNRNAQHATLSGFANVWAFNESTGALEWSYDTLSIQTTDVAGDGTYFYVTGTRVAGVAIPQWQPFLRLINIAIIDEVDNTYTGISSGATLWAADKIALADALAIAAAEVRSGALDIPEAIGDNLPVVPDAGTLPPDTVIIPHTDITRFPTEAEYETAFEAIRDQNEDDFQPTHIVFYVDDSGSMNDEDVEPALQDFIDGYLASNYPDAVVLKTPMTSERWLLEIANYLLS
jgi:hypothetical protein